MIQTVIGDGRALMAVSESDKTCIREASNAYRCKQSKQEKSCR